MVLRVWVIVRRIGYTCPYEVSIPVLAPTASPTRFAKQPFWVLSTTPFGYADCMGTITSTLTVASLTVSSLIVFGHANFMGTPDFCYAHMLGARFSTSWLRTHFGISPFGYAAFMGT